MRHLILFFATLTMANFAIAQNTEINKSYFISAKQDIENMLNGMEQPNYEKAIFIIENAYYENSLNMQSFDFAIQNHINSINEIFKTNYNFNSTNPKPTLLKSKEQLEQQYKKALTNWAIYTYMTSNVGFQDSQSITYHKKYNYSFADPMASRDWTYTQVSNLINTHQGNCFALASLFKILSNRLNSEASLCTAPSHIYISHKDNKGISYNVELGSKNFVGTGTLSTLTHSTMESIKNDIALRELTEKQSVALCLVYLAKGYEHKFNNATDDFILQCAETTIKYDDKNLNALLLKAEYLENKLTVHHKTFSQLQPQKEFQEYQTLIANLYNLGYREIPLQMKNQLIKGWSKDTITKLANVAYKTSEAELSKLLQARQASLSWGLFEENFTNKPTERINNTIFNTKTKKIISFAKDQSLYNNYNFDPVVFAWNIDPLYKKYPNMSPYAFCANSPIAFFDPDGQDLVYFNLKGQEMGRIVSKTVFKTFILTGNITAWTIFHPGSVFSEVPMPKIITAKDNGHGVMTATTGSEYQEYDYNIAAETGIFNHNKNVNNQVPDNTNGNPVDASTVPDLDPTLVKATIMQESTMGMDKGRGLNDATQDIMQANVCYDPSQPNNPSVSDWNEGKKDFGLSLGGGATPQQSIHAGIGIMFRKGLASNGKTSTFSTWNAASKKYNGGGAANYSNVLKMQSTAVTPQSTNYTTPTPKKRK